MSTANIIPGPARASEAAPTGKGQQPQAGPTAPPGAPSPTPGATKPAREPGRLPRYPVNASQTDCTAHILAHVMNRST